MIHTNPQMFATEVSLQRMLEMMILEDYGIAKKQFGEKSEYRASDGRWLAVWIVWLFVWVKSLRSSKIFQITYFYAYIQRKFLYSKYFRFYIRRLDNFYNFQINVFHILQLRTDDL